jgi:hypothetical protein
MNKNQKIALAENNLLVRDLGSILRKHPSYLSSVLSGKFRSPKARKEIAQVLQRDESYLWPEG